MTGGFLNVVNMSITAGYVILAVILMRFLLKKAPKKYSYLLWSVVGFRLCFPFSFNSVFSLFQLNMFKKKVVQNAAGSTIQYMPEQMTAVNAAQTNNEAVLANPVTGTANVSVAEAAGSADRLQVLMQVLAGLWIIGVVVLAVYSVVSFVRLQKRMSTAILLRDNIYQSDKVQSPFIMGFVKPKIYIPFGLDDNALRYVLTHENYHLKRKDHLVKLLAFALLAVHWFNPLCWLAYNLMCKDMEMSCDEKVLAGEANISKAYSMTLLSFAANRRFPVPSPLSFGETGVKGRIKNVLGWKKRSIWISVLAAVVCIVTVIGCAGNPEETTGTTEQETETTESTEETVTLLEGYSEAETEVIYAKLDALVEYRSSDSFPDIAEIWIGASDEEESYCVGTMILRDAEFKGFDYKSDVKAIEMDGAKWLSVTCRAIVEGENGDELYEEDTFELMIPVTTDGNGGVNFGHITGTWHCTHEPIMDEESDRVETLEKVYHSVEADVTHDGIADHVVVFGTKLEDGGEFAEDAEEFFAQAVYWGYVRVYDGSDESYDAADPAASTSLWEKELSLAHVGNGQVSIVQKDGLDYLLESSMWEGQGSYSYSMTLFSLDKEGRIYTAAEYNLDFGVTEENEYQVTDEQRKQVADFRDRTEPLYDGAYLVIALDISDDKGVYVSDAKRTYHAEEYYNVVWERCMEE